MKVLVNKPLAETFSWLRAGGVRLELVAPASEKRFPLSPGETRTVILDDSPDYSVITANLAENACLHLIHIQRAQTPARSCTDLQIRCERNAQFHWYRLVLNGTEVFDNCSVDLAGEGSCFTADIGYRLDGEKKYDVNCEAIHRGRASESRIFSSGVLADRSEKILRGTIDFRSGCSGSAGTESEDVLLLDESVRNLSVPVILCSEEDVAGSHGASIGGPDEQLLYYMESRGFPPADAVRMLSRAKLDAVINRLPGPGLIAEIRRDYL